MASSITFAVVGVAVFNRLRKSGLLLLGRRNDKHKCPVESALCATGVRSCHDQVLQLPRPTYGAVEPVPEGKAGQVDS